LVEGDFVKDPIVPVEDCPENEKAHLGWTNWDVPEYSYLIAAPLPNIENPEA